jgi:hypothetical protein
MSATVWNSSNQDALSVSELLGTVKGMKTKYGPPLKTIKISRATLSLIPLGSNPSIFQGVPVDIDDSLGLWEFKEIYD